MTPNQFKEKGREAFVPGDSPMDHFDLTDDGWKHFHWGWEKERRERAKKCKLSNDTTKTSKIELSGAETDLVIQSLIKAQSTGHFNSRESDSLDELIARFREFKWDIVKDHTFGNDDHTGVS